MCLSHTRPHSPPAAGFRSEPSCLSLGPLFLQHLLPKTIFGNAKNLHDIKMHVPLGFPVNSFSFFFFFFFFQQIGLSFTIVQFFFLLFKQIFQPFSASVEIFSFITLWQMKVKRSNY